MESGLQYLQVKQFTFDGRHILVALCKKGEFYGKSKLFEFDDLGFWRENKQLFINAEMPLKATIKRQVPEHMSPDGKIACVVVNLEEGFYAIIERDSDGRWKPFLGLGDNFYKQIDGFSSDGMIIETFSLKDNPQINLWKKNTDGEWIKQDDVLIGITLPMSQRPSVRGPNYQFTVDGNVIKGEWFGQKVNQRLDANVSQALFSQDGSKLVINNKGNLEVWEYITFKEFIDRTNETFRRLRDLWRAFPD